MIKKSKSSSKSVSGTKDKSVSSSMLVKAGVSDSETDISVSEENDFKIVKITRKNNGDSVSYPLLVPKYDFDDVATNNKKKGYKDAEIRYKEYYDAGLYPFLKYYKVNNIEVVPISFFDNIQEADFISEKSEYVDASETSQGIKGNQIQTRALNYRFYGLFTQRRGRISTNNIPEEYARTIFKTNEIRADDDDLGHFMAFANNMYALKDPYAKTLLVKRENGSELIRPNPVLVNRAFVKSIFDSIGFEQGKVIAKQYKQFLKRKGVKSPIVKETGKSKIRAGIFTYRDAKGDIKDLNITEQKMAIANFFAPAGASVFAKTPTSEIRFEVTDDMLKNIELESKDKGVIQFIPSETSNVVIDETKGSRLLTSDELLTASVKKYNMKATTAQASAESLYRQGYITYPRVDEKSNQIQDTGIKVLVDMDKFVGSNEEKKILTVINEGNKALADNKSYLMNGVWQLRIGDDIIANTETTDVFWDEERYFDDSQFDLIVKEKGKTNYELTDYLIRKKIGTKATRTPQIEELLQAGIITTEFQDRSEIYRLDTRGLFFAAGYDYLLKNNQKSVLELGNKVKEMDNLPDIVKIWNSYSAIDESKFAKHISTKANEYLESEADLDLIDRL